MIVKKLYFPIPKYAEGCTIMHCYICDKSGNYTLDRVTDYNKAKYQIKDTDFRITEESNTDLIVGKYNTGDITIGNTNSFRLGISNSFSLYTITLPVFLFSLGNNSLPIIYLYNKDDAHNIGLWESYYGTDQLYIECDISRLNIVKVSNNSIVLDHIKISNIITRTAGPIYYLPAET